MRLYLVALMALCVVTCDLQACHRGRARYRPPVAVQSVAVVQQTLQVASYSVPPPVVTRPACANGTCPVK